jgi:hypothetical protein
MQRDESANPVITVGGKKYPSFRAWKQPTGLKLLFTNFYEVCISFIPTMRPVSLCFKISGKD